MIISSSTTVHRRSIVPRGAGGVPMNMISRSEGRKARRLRLAREMAASFDAVRGTRPGTPPPRSRSRNHTHIHTNNSGKPPAGRLYRGKSGNKNASGASLFEAGTDLALPRRPFTRIRPRQLLSGKLSLAGKSMTTATTAAARQQRRTRPTATRGAWCDPPSPGLLLRPIHLVTYTLPSPPPPRLSPFPPCQEVKHKRHSSQ